MQVVLLGFLHAPEMAGQDTITLLTGKLVWVAWLGPDQQDQFLSDEAQACQDLCTAADARAC